MKLKQGFISSTGLALILLANLSSATDYKVYSGAGCQPRTGAEANAFLMDAVAGIVNLSTQAHIVTCPLVRDRVPAPNALDPGMHVASANGALLLCNFFSVDQNGNRLDRVERFTTASSSTPLVFAGTPIRSEGAGSYAFECVLPPGGRVINYSIGEAGETGNTELP